MANKPTAQTQTTVKPFVPCTRSDGQQSHNLEWTSDAKYLYLRIDLTAPSILSANGKPMISCSKGFVGLMDSTVNISLNAMDKRNKR